MQTSNLPVCIKHKIDQAFGRFIWSRAHPQQKMSLVSWDRVCQLKNCGGLGFNNLELMNKALLMKLGWNLVASPNSLWSQVLCTKYNINPANLPYILPTGSGSHLWKSIGKVWPETRLGIRWNLGNGRLVRFWWDCWVTKRQPWISYVLSPVFDNIIHKVTTDFVDSDGNWQ